MTNSGLVIETRLGFPEVINDHFFLRLLFSSFPHPWVKVKNIRCAGDWGSGETLMF